MLGLNCGVNNFIKLITSWIPRIGLFLEDANGWAGVKANSSRLWQLGRSYNGIWLCMIMFHEECKERWIRMGIHLSVKYFFKEIVLSPFSMSLSARDSLPSSS